MDKKNTIFGVLLIGAAIFLMSQDMRTKQRAAEEQRKQLTQTEQVKEAVSNPEALPTSVAEATGGETRSVFAAADLPEPAIVAAPESDLPEQTYDLANEHIRVTFTSKGGAIKHVAFTDTMPDGRLKYPATLNSEEPYIFGAGSEKPALAISMNLDSDGVPDEFAPDFTVTKIDKVAGVIQFAYQDASGGAIVRNYVLTKEGGEQDPYVIQHDTHFINKSDKPLPLEAMFLNVGSAPPTKGDVRKEFLNFGYYAAGDAEFIKMSKFTGSKGFMGMGASPERDAFYEGMDNAGGEIVWVSIKNQFFTSVLTPTDALGSGIFAKPIDLGESIEDPDLQMGMTGAMEFDLGSVPVGEQKSIRASYYVGPKEYFRLNTLGQNQDEIMQFGFFGGISKILLWALVGIHGILVHVAPTWGWGFSIILLTCFIKALLWPLTQVQVKSAKAMGKIQAPMKELQEKYKDNPTKLQQETMKLFKENKVNPAAGCLPIVLQIPIFFALFYMLRTSSDLRFSPFLWIKDLSVPDTLPFMPDWFHLMPLLMGAAMVVQMRMTPTPTTDNMQRKIFQFMPLIFLAFCYKFPSGLVLYWTVQNCISILQQWLTNRKRDDAPKDGVIDVTPAKEPAKKKAANANSPKKGGKKKR
ncbi:membrane protein insertase YidC [Cerasicoccus arenae]|uniref:Membrane protein insertase YidC n=1 Tax=Cerasicoccus arenae TaxID=424488 RepID=A0A8J3DGA5_9BACT|nr:membrane protein insertase YidC [Cerasicoccus arenae]MBK1859164.1 membrane protein insertase YidC [Cerasicoccus arenae]GHB98222.1 membrane protein insertase YidC [Cerasicoccus arenae]